MCIRDRLITGQSNTLKPVARSFVFSPLPPVLKAKNGKPSTLGLIPLAIIASESCNSAVGPTVLFGKVRLKES